jgi:ABC-2 type transport system permease protein
MFIVRQLTGAWAAWEINFEVRTGALSMRLLRPIHPLWHYAVGNLAAVPMRLLLALPVSVIALVAVGTVTLPKEPRMWMLWCFAMLGSWLITFLANVCIGALSLFMESSIKVMDVWITTSFVFSGYIVPVELFPKGLAAVAHWLPFRYQLGFPVEVMISMHDFPTALGLLARQWMFVVFFWGLATLLWRSGLRRFGAFGG